MCNFRVLIIFLGITFCLFIPSIHSLITVYGDILLILDNLQLTLPIMSCLIRIIIFWWKKEAILPILNMIMKDWKKIKNDQERNLMIRRAQTARIIITCSYCIIALQWTFISVLPIFGVTMRLTSNITDPGRMLMPLQSHYIYDITKSPQYELTFISQAVYLVIAMMTYSGVDNFLSLVVFHICGQLDILANRMQHLDKYKNYPQVLKRCIEKHIHLLRAINIIEDTYNKILLSLFIYFVILFAFYGFRIISLFDEGNMSIIHLIYFIPTIISLFIHMYLYCVLGEILLAQVMSYNECFIFPPLLCSSYIITKLKVNTDSNRNNYVFLFMLFITCNKIYYMAYSSKWYTMDPTVARDLLFLMKRGSKEIYLTVGKMSPVTMVTFCSVRYFNIYYNYYIKILFSVIKI
ncbi:OR13A protein, partial [Acromyrmex insinuator]